MVELRTAAWYGDRPLRLEFPSGWDVQVHWPATPAPLAEPEIAAKLADPVELPRLREFARGAVRPVVLVDDLTRPTPAARVFPELLRELAEAGVPAERVSILLASGAHGRVPPDAIVKKVGAEAAASCRLLFHDPRGSTTRVGRTSLGTVVRVNPVAASSDLLLGIGGIYPQFTTGFGGGSKLALGALASSSIAALHYRHSSVDGSYAIENDFRRDLDEIARLVGLRWSLSMHVDAARQPVRVACGDHERYYADEVAFARHAFAAPLAGDANVVIANAYPVDVSLTFARSKGVIPLLHAAPTASRVLIAACPERVGLHTLFPFVHAPSLHRQRHLVRMVRYRPRTAAAQVIWRARAFAARGVAIGSPAPPARRPISLFVPGGEPRSLPESIPDMKPLYTWADVLERVSAEQGRSRSLKVAIYPCAPLHVLDVRGL